MEEQVLRNWFFSLIFTIAFVSILALDIGERQTFYNSMKRRGQSSSHQNQHGGLCLPKQLPNEHNDFAVSNFDKKTSKIVIDSPLLTENISNLSRKSANQKTKKYEEKSTLIENLLLSPSNNGNEKKSSIRFSNNTGNNDEKKTLSQQVKEGKYGLIQNEIYSVNPKRPGIISYLSNSEVPHDTIKNFGGLDEEEIWFAENHVLVLKGGKFPDVNMGAEQSEWPPIDNYKAPRRQVKIPAKPRVPPPFPVQLVEGGPIQYIDINGSNLAGNSTIDFDTLSASFKGFWPSERPYFSFLGVNNDNSNITPGLLGSLKKKTKTDGMIPFHPVLPPGAMISPLTNNQTDYDDEDQSIYYPPPYSFIYSNDNIANIPPGPLVPGIILPPPPDFFSSIDEKNSTIKAIYMKYPNTTAIPTLNLSHLSSRKSSTKFYKTPLTTVLPIEAKTFSNHPNTFTETKLKNSTFHEYHQSKKISSNKKSLPFVELVIPKMHKSTTLDSEKYHIQQIFKNQVIEKNTKITPWRTMGKEISLVPFFTTTTAASMEQSVETTPSSTKILTTENPRHNPSHESYYFYEENNEATHTSTSIPFVFFSKTSEISPYYKFELSQEKKPEQKRHQHLSHHEQYLPKQQHTEKEYEIQMIPSQETKNYNIKLIDSIIKNPLLYRFLDSGAISSQEKFEIPSVNEESLRVLYSKPFYYQPLSINSTPKLNFFSTQKSKPYYPKPQIIENLEYKSVSTKSKPIYQYSFESNNYAKQRARTIMQESTISKQHQNQQIHHQIHNSQRSQEPVFSKYKIFQNKNNQYNYENSELVNNQHLQAQKVSYIMSKKNEQRPFYHRSTTGSPVHITTLASHNQYFTKQDEQLLDDVTKEYFTVFGKKLSGSKLPSTTPIYGKSSATDKTQFNTINDYETNQYNEREPNTFTASNIEVRYGDQTPGPFTLKDEIRINYKHTIPLPTVTPNSNFISLVNISPHSSTTEKYGSQPALQLENQIQEYVMPESDSHQNVDQVRNYGNGILQKTSQKDKSSSFKPINDPIRDTKDAVRNSKYSSRPLSLRSDVSVNYKNVRPQINPNSAFISEEIPSHLDSNTNKANTYFAYKLPGDSAHFYFLTPQTIRQEDSSRSYLFSRPRSSK